MDLTALLREILLLDQHSSYNFSREIGMQGKKVDNAFHIHFRLAEVLI